MTDTRSARKFEKTSSSATVSGWGVTKPISLMDQRKNRGSNKIFSGVLQHVEITLIPSYLCARGTSYFYRRKTMLCAYDSYHVSKAPCLGDNGSPLTIKDPKTNRWVLLGIYSWSEGCGQPNRYSYFTRVSRYEHWIKKITNYSDEDL